MKRLVLLAVVPLIASFGLAVIPASGALASSANCGGTSLIDGQPIPRVAPSEPMRVPTVGNGTPNQFLCVLGPGGATVPVMRLQIDLNYCYSNTLAVDGQYGPLTTQAVR